VSSPEVTVILSTQGKRSTLASALRSALAQDFASYEIVIVDDSAPAGEWRNRPDLVELLSSPRVRIVPFHQSRGCAAPKNAGLAAARGRWVCYLDDDNEYHPNKVGAQHALAVATGSPLVLCGLAMVAGGRRRLRQVRASSYSGDALVLGAAPDTNVLFHRRDAGVMWDEALRTADDACFFHALVARHRLTTVPNVPEPLVLYRVHGGAHENSGYERVYRGQRRLLVRWLPAYSARARRIALLRALVSFHKYRPGRWGALVRRSCQLVRSGGWSEWRLIANTIGVRLPVVRRWMIN
jgi:teichuronic acid biosynthesis glycosyltransferase TuaG